MRIDVERFLTITAMLAAGTAVALGCSSEDVQNDPKNDGGISGASGRGGSSGASGSSGRGGTAGTGGSAGTAGTAGASGTGGTSDGSAGDGSVGTGGTAGADGGACLGDTSATDAGAEPCGDLPYAAQLCGDGGNVPASGMELCEYMAVNGRAGVFEVLKTCLASVGDAGTACSAAHDTAVQGCIDSVFPQACDGLSTTRGDGAVATCTDVSEACEVDGGTSPLSVADCENSLHAFTAAARTEILECFELNDQGPCVDTFEICLFDPAYEEP